MSKSKRKFAKASSAHGACGICVNCVNMGASYCNFAEFEKPHAHEALLDDLFANEPIHEPIDGFSTERAEKAADALSDKLQQIARTWKYSELIRRPITAPNLDLIRSDFEGLRRFVEESDAAKKDPPKLEVAESYFERFESVKQQLIASSEKIQRYEHDGYIIVSPQYLRAYKETYGTTTWPPPIEQKMAADDKCIREILLERSKKIEAVKPVFQDGKVVLPSSPQTVSGSDFAPGLHRPWREMFPGKAYSVHPQKDTDAALLIEANLRKKLAQEHEANQQIAFNAMLFALVAVLFYAILTVNLP